jgi:hypothetical protein
VDLTGSDLYKFWALTLAVLQLWKLLLESQSVTPTNCFPNFTAHRILLDSQNSTELQTKMKGQSVKLNIRMQFLSGIRNWNAAEIKSAYLIWVKNILHWEQCYTDGLSLQANILISCFVTVYCKKSNFIWHTAQRPRTCALNILILSTSAQFLRN